VPGLITHSSNQILDHLFLISAPAYGQPFCLPSCNSEKHHTQKIQPRRTQFMSETGSNKTLFCQKNKLNMLLIIAGPGRSSPWWVWAKPKALFFKKPTTTGSFNF
jgi:hypothetical protein